jgi:peptide/nickel transport system permease protein
VLRYFIGRVITAMVMALLATVVVFLIANEVPSDPVVAQLGDYALEDPQMVAAFRAKWGYDRPLWERYGIFLAGLEHGDLGTSIVTRRPVLEDIIEYAPATVELGSVAFLLSVLVGVPLGILAAVKRDKFADHFARFISLIGVSSPGFWVAFLMLAVFYGGLQIAPGPGRLDPAAIAPSRITGLYLVDTLLANDWSTFADAVCHLVLPSTVLMLGALGLITRTTRAGMLEALNQDYIRVARAKGVKRRQVVLRHALPNALVPLVTVAGITYAQLLTGAVMTETVFAWPGLGKYTFNSAVALDIPAIMGITLLVAVVFLAINLLIDLSYPLLDPRILS